MADFLGHRHFLFCLWSLWIPVHFHGTESWPCKGSCMACHQSSRHVTGLLPSPTGTLGLAEVIGDAFACRHGASQRHAGQGPSIGKLICAGPSWRQKESHVAGELFSDSPELPVRYAERSY
ncbi:hypothetical protein M5C99_21070 [Acidovorax sp. NCPPB 2350]|nr:hypothetical protein M5C99_21070 [Acidovorax sp. NCPPB 2350]